MRISDVLRVKGTQVVTVTPDTKVRRLLAVLAEHRIGAVVVSETAPRSTGSPVSGHRPAFARRGAAAMSEPVTAICTVEVAGHATDLARGLMRMMTEHRVRTRRSWLTAVCEGS